MRALGLRGAAWLATVLVLALGAFQLRDLLVETEDGTYSWDPAVGTLSIDAGDGVRIALDLTGGEAAATWHSRVLLARATVSESGTGRLVVRCEAPTPISRCAVWLSVFAGAPGVSLEVIQRPGAIVTGDTTDSRVTIVRPNVP